MENARTVTFGTSREFNPAYPMLKLLEVPKDLVMSRLKSGAWIFVLPQDVSGLFYTYSEVALAMDGIDFFNPDSQVVKAKILAALRRKIIEHNDMVLQAASEIPEWLMNLMPMTDVFRRAWQVYRTMMVENPSMEPSP